MSKRYIAVIIAVKLIVALYLLAVAFSGIENIISDGENGFAVSYWNHTIEAYDTTGYRLASVKTEGRTKLVSYSDKDIIIYRYDRGIAEYYASSGDFICDVELDISDFINTKRMVHSIGDASLVYERRFGFEHLTLITADGERVIYDGTSYMLIKLAAFYFTAFVIYLKVCWNERIFSDPVSRKISH